MLLTPLIPMSVAQAQTQLNLTNMDEDIFRQPWKSFERIMALKPQLSSMDETQQLWWLVRKAQSENLLYFHGEFTKTVKQALQLINDNSPLEIKARLNHFQALIWQKSAQYKQSEASFRLAMQQAKQAKLSHIYIKAKQELAYNQSLTELFETSLKDMQEAYVEAFVLNDHFLLALINETYGAIYGYMQEYEKSIEYYEKALDTYEGLGYKAHIAEAVYGLASTYRYWKKFELASDKFRLYREKISYTPNKEISYYGTYGLGMTLAEQGKCLEAITVIDQALVLEGIIDYDAELYKRKASCLIQLKQLQKAEVSLQAAANIFVQLPELIGTAWQLEVLKISAELSFAKGEHKKGYQQLKRYTKQYSELLIKNSSSRVISVRASMEVERHEIEKILQLQLSRVETLEVEAEQQNKIQQNYLILFLMLLLIVVIIVVIVQHQTNKKITALSIIDHLSGLYNRRYIFQYLAKFINEVPSAKKQLVILLVDIDDFKNINDSHGHPIGDKVIEHIAEIAQETLRTADVMGRIGGEEFLCVLPRIELEQSITIAQRMLKNISSNQIQTEDGGLVNVTVSIGVAQWTSDISDAKTLYSYADQALYQAKNLGKNRVEVY